MEDLFRMKLGLIAELVRDDAHVDLVLERGINAVLDYAAGADFAKVDLDEIRDAIDARVNGGDQGLQGLSNLAMARILSAILCDDPKIAQDYLESAQMAQGYGYGRYREQQEKRFQAAVRWTVRLAAHDKGLDAELRSAALAAVYGGAVELAAELVGATVLELSKTAHDIVNA